MFLFPVCFFLLWPLLVAAERYPEHGKLYWGEQLYIYIYIYIYMYIYSSFIDIKNILHIRHLLYSMCDVYLADVFDMEYQ